MDAAGAHEVHFPALLPREPYEATGRWNEYGDGIFRLQDRKGADYLLAPTHEEVFTLLVKDLYSSYKDLPLSIYQIQDKYRDEARPRAGLLRGREFTMKDAYSFDYTDAGLDASLHGAARRLRAHLPAPRPRIRHRRRRMPAPWAARAARSSCTPPRSAKTPSCAPPAATRRTSRRSRPLVRRAAAVRRPAGARGVRLPEYARPSPRSSTLANATHPRPDGRLDRRRHAQERRAGAHAPGRHARARRRRPARRPRRRPQARRGRVRTRRGRGGHRGRLRSKQPAASSRATSARGPPTGAVLGEESATGIRYLLDPRVVDGTAWITGANDRPEARLRSSPGATSSPTASSRSPRCATGDPAPDGSGPVELARGMEIGHVFQLGRKYAEALGLKVLDENGKLVTVTMGSYGIGVTRILAIIAEANNDDKGLIWPRDGRAVRRARGRDAARTPRSSRRPRSSSPSSRPPATTCSSTTGSRCRPGVKFGDAELIGVPLIVIVGQGAADGDRRALGPSHRPTRHALARRGALPSGRLTGSRDPVPLRFNPGSTRVLCPVSRKYCISGTGPTGVRAGLTQKLRGMGRGGR